VVFGLIPIQIVLEMVYQDLEVVPIEETHVVVLPPASMLIHISVNVLGNVFCKDLKGKRIQHRKKGLLQ